MQVVHFCPSRSFSGMEQYILDLALGQKDRGLTVGLVAHPQYELFERAQSADVKVIPFNPYVKFSWFSFKSTLVPLLQSDDLKVIHLHSTQDLKYFWPHLSLWNRKRKSRCKIIQQNHIWLGHAKKDPFHKLTFSILDEVWCSSQRAKSSLSKQIPVSSEKIKVVRYGRDTGKTSEMLPGDVARRELGLPQKDVVIGCVSRIEEGKGVMELVKGFVTPAKHNDSIHLVIIGGPSPQNLGAEAYNKKIEELVHSLPSSLRERIKLLGTIPQAHRFLKAFDLYALPSYEECFSLSLLDSLLAGVPVVATDTGGTPDAVIPQKTGWLTSPRSAEGFASALKQALMEKDRWKEFGQEGQRLVRESFDSRQIFDEIVDRYGIR